MPLPRLCPSKPCCTHFVSWLTCILALYTLALPSNSIAPNNLESLLATCPPILPPLRAACRRLVYFPLPPPVLPLEWACPTHWSLSSPQAFGSLLRERQGDRASKPYIPRPLAQRLNDRLTVQKAASGTCVERRPLQTPHP
jgi:hypothetical protein